MNIALLIIYLVGAVVAMVLQTRINIANKKNKVEQTKFDLFFSILCAGLMSVFYVFVYYMVINVEQKDKDVEKYSSKD